MRLEKFFIVYYWLFWSIVRFFLKFKFMDKLDEEFQFFKELMEDWSIMEVCVDCKKFILEIISLSWCSLVLVNKWV